MATCLSTDRTAVDRLRRWLAERSDAEHAAIQARAVTQFQQLSAPVAAKAVEDTAFYRYGRLLSRNDVGFDVTRFSDSAADFHAHALRRQRTFRTRCWRPRRTTTSAARTCAPGSRS